MNFHLDQSVRDFIGYDAVSGGLTWLRNRGRVRAGSRAGSLHQTADGGRYVRVKFEGRHIFAHRIAWYLAHGEDRSDIDHKDRDGTNNRLANLRPASRSQQAANRRGFGKLSKGVYQTRHGSFTAHIRVDGRKLHLGTFSTEAEAFAVYSMKAKEAFGEFASLP